MQTDVTYFRQRAAEERLAAERVSDPRARDPHSQLADAYERLVQQLEDLAKLQPR